MVKKNLFLVLLFICASSIFAKPEFSLSWENSFLTGKGIVKGEKPEDYDFEKNIKGGQSIFIFRCKLNDYFSVGAGSGVSVSKLNFSMDIWGTIDASVAMFYVPIFVELRGYLPVNDALSFYGGTKIGGSVSPLEIVNSGDYSIWKLYFTGGFFLEPMAGLSFNHKRFLFDLGVGYHLQKSAFVDDYYYKGDEDYGEEPYYEYEKYPLNLNQFVVKLGWGVRFGKIK